MLKTSSDMPAFSTPKSTIIDDALWLRTHAIKDGVPADCQRAYQVLFNNTTGYFKKVIDDIIQLNGGAIQLPMQPAYIERYLSGYTFEYRPFCNITEYKPGTEGFWQIDPKDSSHVIVYYNRSPSSKRERFTQVHELFHFIQSRDPYFLSFMDELILDTELPEKLIVKLLERTTDRAAAMFLMPNQYFIKKFEEIQAVSPVFGEKQLRELAAAFEVSVESARFRVQECVPQFALAAA